MTDLAKDMAAAFNLSLELARKAVEECNTEILEMCGITKACGEPLSLIEAKVSGAADRRHNDQA